VGGFLCPEILVTDIRIVKPDLAQLRICHAMSLSLPRDVQVYCGTGVLEDHRQTGSYPERLVMSVLPTTAITFSSSL
jgi:hypothetical protein